jgi:predicted transposase YbfD/YdcC
VSLRAGTADHGDDLGYHTLIVPKVGTVPALSSSPVVPVHSQPASAPADARDRDGAPLVSTGLLSLLAQVTDPRKRRGIRHTATSIVAVALAATLAGARSFTAITEWAADAPAEALARLGVRRRPPSEPTIRRLLSRLPADTLDTVIGAWMWLRTSTIGGRRVIAFDGKTLRGARDTAGNLTHLLAGLCQRTGVVLGQVRVGAKTNEIPMLAGLLTVLDINGAVITADAMHCQRDTAQTIRDRGGHYILTVKGNQPNLRKRVKSLPWKDIPPLAISREHGHGRQDTRTLKATELTSGIGFPGAAQVLRLTRTRTIRKTGKRTRETVYAITSLTVADAGPEQIATWLRGHWMIENRLHWIRDVDYDEDRSQIHTGSGPQVMATLRNTAIGLLRLAGHTSIATALRYHTRDFNRPVELLLTC